jgi:hypothetical protein
VTTEIKSSEMVSILKRIWQPAFFGYVFFTGREGYIGNPASPLIPNPTGGGGGGGGGGNPSVFFNVERNGTAYKGTGYVTVNGVNHVTTGTGTYSTTYAVGTVLSVTFTGFGVTCTPTAPISYTVINSTGQGVTIPIPC